MICHPDKGDCIVCTFGSIHGCEIDTGVKLWAQDQGYGVSKYSGRPYKREAGKARGCLKMTTWEKAAMTKGERE